MERVSQIAVTIMTREEIEIQLSSATGQFYVYYLLRPDGTPFYVGKGYHRRIFDHETEAQGDGRTHKLNVIRMIINSGKKLGYEIVAFYERNEEALQREVEEIHGIGRHDLKKGPLTNLTNGGEGTSGLDSANPDLPGERGIANRFFLKLCPTPRSIPVRPASEFKPIALIPHRRRLKPTRRMAGALAASAIANRVLLEPGCVIPRKMVVEDTVMLIENGAGASILESGMATLSPGQPAGDERFVLNQRGVKQLIALSNVHLLLDAGILMPRE